MAFLGSPASLALRLQSNWNPAQDGEQDVYFWEGKWDLLMNIYLGGTFFRPRIGLNTFFSFLFGFGCAIGWRISFHCLLPIPPHVQVGSILSFKDQGGSYSHFEGFWVNGWKSAGWEGGMDGLWLIPTNPSPPSPQKRITKEVIWSGIFFYLVVNYLSFPRERVW